MSHNETIEICPWSGNPIKKRPVVIFDDQDAKVLAELEAKMEDKSYRFPDADGYYRARQAIRELRAKREGMKSWQYDPMGYAFDMQSN